MKYQTFKENCFRKCSQYKFLERNVKILKMGISVSVTHLCYINFLQPKFYNPFPNCCCVLTCASNANEYIVLWLIPWRDLPQSVSCLFGLINWASFCSLYWNCVFVEEATRCSTLLVSPKVSYFPEIRHTYSWHYVTVTIPLQPEANGNFPDCLVLPQKAGFLSMT